MNAPFVRFSRDRRGYEHFYILQAVPDRRGRMRQRVLYWYRTPPQVKVGREPFDESVRGALEAQYPGVPFDWEKIRNTPIPPVEPEYWRERRLAERASRQAAAEDAGRGVEPGETRVPPAPPTEGGMPVESRRSRRRRRRRDRTAGGPQAVQTGASVTPGPPGPADSSPEPSLEAGEAGSAEPDADSGAGPDGPQSGQ